MPKIDVISGRVVYVSPERAVLARGTKLFEKRQGASGWKEIADVPVSSLRRRVMSTPLLGRLMRGGIHHFESVAGGCVVCANRETYVLSHGKTRLLESLHGSRPMTFCSLHDRVYYGEYRSNPERLPVSVWYWEAGMEGWDRAWTFEKVRHVHGVFFDPYSDSIWVTTGDDDSEAAIWRTDDRFGSLSRVAGGSQQLRSVQLLFTMDHIYFGSDTPWEKNHIYRMDRNGERITCLAEVGGSVFYGSKVGPHLFFSTAVEPSKVNLSRCSELWYSSDGSTWKKVLDLKKDRWSRKYFQHGQLLFPNGPGDGQNLYVSPYAVSHHGVTLVTRANQGCFGGRPALFGGLDV